MELSRQPADSRINRTCRRLRGCRGLEMLISAKIRVNPRRNFEIGRNLGANFFGFAPCGSVQLSLSIRDESRPAGLVMAVTDF